MAYNDSPPQGNQGADPYNPFNDPKLIAAGANKANDWVQKNPEKAAQIASSAASTAASQGGLPPVPGNAGAYNDNAYAGDSAKNSQAPPGNAGAYNDGVALEVDSKPGVMGSAGTHQAPQSDFCSKFCLWFPVHWFAFLAGVSMVSLPIIDMAIVKVAGGIQFTRIFVYLYAIVFGLVITFVEAPCGRVLQKCKLRIYYWSRFLSRLWGRSIFYTFVSLLPLADAPNATMAATILMFLISLIMLGVSRSAAHKYNRLVEWVSQGHETNAEVAEMAGAMFDKYDMNVDGELEADEVASMFEASGRILTNAQQYAIVIFIDQNCVGKVTRDDFVGALLEFRQVKFL